MKKFKNVLLGLFALMLVVVPIALTGCGEVKTSLEIFREFKTDYYYGEELDLEGGILKYTESGKEPEYIYMTDEGVEVKYFDSELLGTHELVIEYKETTLEIEYTIKAIIDITDGWYYSGDPEGGYGCMKFEDGVYYSMGYIEEELNSLDDVVQLIKSGTYELMPLECTREFIDGKWIYTGLLRDEDLIPEEDEAAMTFVFTPDESGKALEVKVMQGNAWVSFTAQLLEI